MHGFNKLLILLTEPGKVFAISSFDGTVKWQFYIPQEKVVKVFVQHQEDGNARIVVITCTSEIYLDPVTGNRISMIHHKIDAS